MQEIAFGELGLHPEQFYEYSMEEFVIKVEAARKVAEGHLLMSWRQTRRLCYYVVAAQLGKKAPKEEYLFELPGDKVKRSRVSQMNSEQKKEWIKNIAERLRQEGVITDN